MAMRTGANAAEAAAGPPRVTTAPLEQQGQYAGWRALDAARTGNPEVSAVASRLVPCGGAPASSRPNRRQRDTQIGQREQSWRRPAAAGARRLISSVRKPRKARAWCPRSRRSSSAGVRSLFLPSLPLPSPPPPPPPPPQADAAAASITRGRACAWSPRQSPPRASGLGSKRSHARYALPTKRARPDAETDARPIGEAGRGESAVRVAKSVRDDRSGPSSAKPGTSPRNTARRTGYGLRFARRPRPRSPCLEGRSTPLPTSTLPDSAKNRYSKPEFSRMTWHWTRRIVLFTIVCQLDPRLKRCGSCLRAARSSSSRCCWAG